MKSRVVLAACTFAAWLWLPQIAVAQTAAPKAAPEAEQQRVQQERSDPKACAPRQRETTGAPIGEKLAQTDGVICPPAGMDPDIRVPPPQSGARTPVIPPPGSRGGDQSVQPK